MKARTALVAACLAAMGGPLAACSASQPAAPAVKSDPNDPAAAVRAAADATSRAGASRTRTTISMTVAGKPVTLHGAGEFDYAKGVGELTLDVPPHTGLSGQLAEIVTPQALYLKNALPNVPKDKWVRLDASKVAGGLFSGGGNSPATSFEMLRGASPGVRLVGEDTLSGVAVRHYQGTLDIDRAASLATGGTRTALQAAGKTLADKSIPFDAYLDQQGRLRRVDETLMLASNGASGRGTPIKVSSSAQLYDFGVPVVVKTPPSSHVVLGDLGGR